MEKRIEKIHEVKDKLFKLYDEAGLLKDELYHLLAECAAEYAGKTVRAADGQFIIEGVSEIFEENGYYKVKYKGSETVYLQRNSEIYDTHTVPDVFKSYIIDYNGLIDAIFEQPILEIVK